MNGRDGGKESMEKPLAGCVLCCTSIPMELKTAMADAALQMGAVHNLDLTSDVTHLIVGDSNTAKYKYVARERQDVKVLRPDWFEAVRQAWMAGGDVNLKALDELYRLPTFAGLKISVTRYEDLAYRDHLCQAVARHGGYYQGDLTRDVTHLIAKVPSGKKYEYATQWGVKVVGDKWLRDSVSRRMILDEALYHPSLPEDQQGIGAFVPFKPQMQPVKHAVDDDLAGRPRKLRRTASAKLGSQTESLWGDIVNGREGGEENEEARSAVGPVVVEPRSFSTHRVETGHQEHVSKPGVDIHQTSAGIFAGHGFVLHGFVSRQMKVFQTYIPSNQGVLFESMRDLEDPSLAETYRMFFVVPHTLSPSEIPITSNLLSKPEVITEVWVERCLQLKRFFEPDEYALSRPMRVFPIPGFEKLTINSTGTADIIKQVVNAIKLLGARYEELLKPGVNIMLCNTNKAKEEKLIHAQAWEIPVVSIDWLWSCVKHGKMPPLKPFLYRQPIQQLQNKVASGVNGQVLITNGDRPQQAGLRNVTKQEIRTENKRAWEQRDRQSQEVDSDGKARRMQGDGFLVGQDSAGSNLENAQIGNKEAHNDLPTAKVERRKAARGGDQPAFPIDSLPHLSANSQSRLTTKAVEPNATEQEEDETPPAPEATSTAKTVYIPPQGDSVSEAISGLLSRNNSEPKNKNLLSRALSNLSNSSREGHHLRRSRASSIDSLNTDGVGSAIAVDDFQPPTAMDRSLSRRSSFKGRALLSSRNRSPSRAIVDMGDSSLYSQQYIEEAQPPPMTQIGYENPEDAVALREELAAKRRARTRNGLESPPSGLAPESKRIRDEPEALHSVNLGPGRRTRQQVRDL